MSEVNDPINPARLPTINPSLLVVDCIRLDRIGELTIEPTIKRDIGNVAWQTLLARDCPTRPPKIIYIGIWEPKIACATANAKIFLWFSTFNLYKFI